MAWLIAGLGNPGPDYKNDRHNLGFMVLDELSRRFGVAASSFKGKFGSEIASTDIQPGSPGSRRDAAPFGSKEGSVRVYLQKPMEYMNVSGQAVQRAAAFFQVEPANLIVIHDELDLPFGKLRVKVGGGHGGHNGLRSISQALGPEYLRLRCGIGKPAGGKDKVTGHVLSPFSKAELAELPFLVTRAADAAEAILGKGIDYAMNHFNKDPVPA